VVDDWEQASHSGEINVPLEKGLITKDMIYGELGEIVAGLKPGRLSDKEITVFDSTGLSIQDVITAWHVYNIATKKNIGIEMDAFYLPR
ncbi:MAG: ornithine cyclodeaminase family protein, partial [Nitrososphaerota archaeon]